MEIRKRNPRKAGPWGLLVKAALVIVAVASMAGGIFCTTTPALRCIAFAVALTATASMLPKKYGNWLSGIALVLILAAFALLAMGMQPS